jgi:putative membrane protein
MNNTSNLPAAGLAKNDRKATTLILIFSVVVFLVVAALGRINLNISVGFDVHIFAKLNAVINTLTAILLVAALMAVKRQRYELHKAIMLFALALSVVFLVSYIAHHLLAGEARYGDINHDGIVDASELAQAGSMRMVYFVILSTHIALAAIILPFILFTAYRGLIAEFPAHKKLARYTWPLWFYVAVTGPVVYFMISPYYR